MPANATTMPCPSFQLLAQGGSASPKVPPAAASEQLDHLHRLRLEPLELFLDLSRRIRHLRTGRRADDAAPSQQRFSPAAFRPMGGQRWSADGRWWRRLKRRGNAVRHRCAAGTGESENWRYYPHQRMVGDTRGQQGPHRVLVRAGHRRPLGALLEDRIPLQPEVLPQEVLKTRRRRPHRRLRREGKGNACRRRQGSAHAQHAKLGRNGRTRETGGRAVGRVGGSAPRSAGLETRQEGVLERVGAALHGVRVRLRPPVGRVALRLEPRLVEKGVRDEDLPLDRHQHLPPPKNPENHPSESDSDSGSDSRKREEERSGRESEGRRWAIGSKVVWCCARLQEGASRWVPPGPLPGTQEGEAHFPAVVQVRVEADFGLTRGERSAGVRLEVGRRRDQSGYAWRQTGEPVSQCSRREWMRTLPLACRQQMHHRRPAEQTRPMSA